MGSPTSAYWCPGSCAGPRHWDTQGDRRTSPSKSRTPSLLGDSRGGGGATGPEVHTASRSAKQELAQEIPTWPAAQSPPSPSPHPDPGRGSEVVAKVSGGGPGRGLGRGPARSGSVSLAQWGGLVARLRASQFPEPSSPLAQALRAHFPGRVTLGQGRGRVLPAFLSTQLGGALPTASLVQGATQRAMARG